MLHFLFIGSLTHVHSRNSEGGVANTQIRLIAITTIDHPEKCSQQYIQISKAFINSITQKVNFPPLLLTQHAIYVNVHRSVTKNLRDQKLIVH